MKKEKKVPKILKDNPNIVSEMKTLFDFDLKLYS